MPFLQAFVPQCDSIEEPVQFKAMVGPLSGHKINAANNFLLHFGEGGYNKCSYFV